MIYLQKAVYQNNTNGSQAKAKDVSTLLNVTDPSQTDFIRHVKQAFPIKNNTINIEGSQEALNTFKNITNRKIDRELTPLDLHAIAFSKNNGINQMSFTIDGKKTTTCYQAKKEFLNTNYNLNDYADFLLDRQENSILHNTLSEAMQSKNIHPKKAIYRFIEDDHKQYLRSIVSSGRYKFYDNPVVFYMGLASVNNLAVKLNKMFYVENLIVTDSKLWVSFLEREATKIGKGITIQTGILLKNSELGDGAARFTAYYLIRDNKGNVVKGLDEQIANINHGYSPLSIEQGFHNLTNYSVNRNNIIIAAKKINWTQILTQEDVMAIMDLISYHLGNNISHTTKIKLNQTLNSVDVVKKTYHLMDVFGKLQSFIDTNDKRIQLILEAKFSNWLQRYFSK